MKNNNKGITLVELIITLGLTAVLFTLIAPLLITGVNFFGDSNNRVMDQTSLRRIMTDLSREIRDAQDVEVPEDGDGKVIEVNGLIYTFIEDDGEISKFNPDNNSTVVVSNRVEEFNVTQTDTATGSLIEFTVRAEGQASTIVTKITTRHPALPTAEIS